jgi:predicted nucleic acid-binding protein
VIYYADSSFLFSFFAKDGHSPKVHRWIRRATHWPVFVTRLTVFEFENSLRTSVLAHGITATQRHEAIQRFRRSMHEGFFLRREVPVNQWFPQAHRVSEFSDERRGFGALDILHISAALYLGADGFLSFDEAQRVLATSEGFRVAP